jgi:poly-gamma-glutamate synthesis protein (capsule biosynthesis protein)
MADNEFLTTPDGSYRCNPIDPVHAFQTITQARQSHDFVVVVVHGGNEFYPLPSPRTKQLYRSLVDMGADAVVSHHTHAFSGYECYRSKPIFYGLGNFLYDWPGKRNQGWNRGYVVRLLLSDQINFDLIPLKQNNEAPGIFHLESAEKELFQNDLERLNGIIADDAQLEAKFVEYCASVFPMYDAFLEPYFGKYITAMRKRGWFPKFLSRRKRLLYLNLVRCESHREVLLRLLKKYE